jgi:hypothetical protein
LLLEAILNPKQILICSNNGSSAALANSRVEIIEFIKVYKISIVTAKTILTVCVKKLNL